MAFRASCQVRITTEASKALKQLFLYLILPLMQSFEPHQQHQTRSPPLFTLCPLW